MEAVDTVCLIGRVLERCPQGLLLCDCCTGQRVMARTDQACRFCPGDLVRVAYSGAMTRSLPPQITALEITCVCGRN